MSNRKQILATQKSYLLAQREKHKLNLDLMLDKPVGVAEHPDIMETIEQERVRWQSMMINLLCYPILRMNTRASRFFLFKCGGWKNEYWIVDENSLQDVPKPRELIIKFSQIEKIREYVIGQNKNNLPIVDRCRDRTEWHTPEGERIRQQTR